ncbi:MAG TPA: uroporphyrinogen-III synthase, partial [Roseiflexaceae bacterium]|nr:uroporphyrinogen-III synthase [Roseiflexaceae bacterium]
GRELLGEVLQNRGASVTHVACYRRKRPPGDMRALLPLWQSGGLQACIATSAEIVSNLFDMAGEAARPRLCQTPMFVPHARVAATAFAGSVRTLYVTGAGDNALVRGLMSWFASPRAETAAQSIVANPS